MTSTTTGPTNTAPRRRSRGGRTYSVIPETLTDSQRDRAALLALAMALEATRAAPTPTAYDAAMILAVLDGKARKLSRQFASGISLANPGTRRAAQIAEGMCAHLKAAFPSLALTINPDPAADAVVLTVAGRPFALGG